MAFTSVAKAPMRDHPLGRDEHPMSTQGLPNEHHWTNGKQTQVKRRFSGFPLAVGPPFVSRYPDFLKVCGGSPLHRPSRIKPARQALTPGNRSFTSGKSAAQNGHVRKRTVIIRAYPKTEDTASLRCGFGRRFSAGRSRSRQRSAAIILTLPTLAAPPQGQSRSEPSTVPGIWLEPSPGDARGQRSRWRARSSARSRRRRRSECVAWNSRARSSVPADVQVGQPAELVDGRDGRRSVAGTPKFCALTAVRAAISPLSPAQPLGSSASITAADGADRRRRRDLGAGQGTSRATSVGTELRAHSRSVLAARSAPAAARINSRTWLDPNGARVAHERRAGHLRIFALYAAIAGGIKSLQNCGRSVLATHSQIRLVSERTPQRAAGSDSRSSVDGAKSGAT